MANPCVAANPQQNTNPEEIKLYVPYPFPSCAITCAMAHLLKESEVDPLPNGTDELRICSEIGRIVSRR